jgi:hypothetical protein
MAAKWAIVSCAWPVNLGAGFAEKAEVKYRLSSVVLGALTDPFIQLRRIFIAHVK